MTRPSSRVVLTPGGLRSGPVEVSFGLLAGASLAILLASSGRPVPALLLGIVLGSVGAHEFGHFLVAVAVGARVELVRFSLLGGGSTRWERAPGSLAAVVVTLAGPMANVAIAVGAGQLGGNYWTILSRVNVVVAVGNLIPMAGSDGSQLLRTLREREPRQAAARTTDD